MENTFEILKATYGSMDVTTFVQYLHTQNIPKILINNHVFNSIEMSKNKALTVIYTENKVEKEIMIQENNVWCIKEINNSQIPPPKTYRDNPPTGCKGCGQPDWPEPKP